MDVKMTKLSKEELNIFLRKYSKLLLDNSHCYCSLVFGENSRAIIFHPCLKMEPFISEEKFNGWNNGAIQ
jgi:hypothetical protein